VTFLVGDKGGAIANRTGPVVGVSNLFGDWRAAADSIAGRYPGLPLVGYESGDDLAAARRAGFTSTGPLRVWLKE
jgi:hypothetical protein